MSRKMLPDYAHALKSGKFTFKNQPLFIMKSRNVLKCLQRIISVNHNMTHYSDNWMILCLLFQIRSPSGYKFLRDQGLLSLPCLLKYIFQLIKKKFINKTQNQKKGVLLLDEIFLRLSINVNSRTLTYSGLQDFGQEVEHKISSFGQVDHGLYPFISKITGVDLAKLVQVVALTSDGASTNKTIYKMLGVSGKRADLKNYHMMKHVKLLFYVMLHILKQY
ncbi:Uncharacterized protein FWK35_00024772 [Aphis craccivora]|uniref:Transposable element P transposase-like RNase H domain-containing protein n=1 Tax=Aphis craccivora TaxID=307492 RepID=A0A6G0W274_APHCR|nr:Uncharacterized protein FWK35_00024772 [Aphis craccivora]